jgi:hypothetical protein
MPAGDYVTCPACGGGMLWGMGVCSTCKAKIHSAKDTFFKGVRVVEETLSDLADAVIGKEEKPTKPVPKFPRPLDDMNKLFDELFAAPPVPSKYQKTLVVNLFAGPGTGKSTAASGIFFDLKNRQINCEIASEYAKDLVWAKRNATFEDQIYLFAKQHHRIFNLLGQVDVIITDCPILLSPVYDAEKRPTFEKLVVEEHKKMWTYNVFLKRQKAYNPKGRLHTEEQAHQIDRAVLDVLDRNNECFETFEASVEGKDAIVRKILMLLQHQKTFGSPPAKAQYFKPMPASERRNR